MVGELSPLLTEGASPLCNQDMPSTTLAGWYPLVSEVAWISAGSHASSRPILYALPSTRATDEVGRPPEALIFAE